jgi:hypothetical protein
LQGSLAKADLLLRVHLLEGIEGFQAATPELGREMIHTNQAFLKAHALRDRNPGEHLALLLGL